MHLVFLYFLTSKSSIVPVPDEEALIDSLVLYTGTTVLTTATITSGIRNTDANIAAAIFAVIITKNAATKTTTTASAATPAKLLCHYFSFAMLRTNFIR